MSARRTFGTLISAGRNRISLLRLGASGDFAVCGRAWRLPAAHKKDWSGLPTASSAARPGVGLLSAGGGHEAIPAIAHTQQAISRAVAQFATQGLLPAADIASRLSCRRRLHFAACLDTAGAAPCPGLGLLGCLVDIGTCQDASTSARRTWPLPARVIPPRDSVSPLERSEGARPHHEANDGALGNLEKCSSRPGAGSTPTSQPRRRGWRPSGTACAGGCRPSRWRRATAGRWTCRPRPSTAGSRRATTA